MSMQTNLLYLYALCFSLQKYLLCNPSIKDSGDAFAWFLYQEKSLQVLWSFL